MIMPHLMKDFKRISDALYSSNKILSKEQIPENAQRRLQEAEQSLNKAIHHVLSDKRNIAQK
ncbi:hypothetical protein [Siminovitchia acidinfaciens]|uniref:hypothetical protein n=1 Tax=Siminovitchia acidinfaciens TaxID=2321395 RepID=UPI000EDD0D64|nr:hypothetical protein [Siminovitchia acidinfaciens]